MAKIIDVISRMLPAGSVFGGGQSVRPCPFWPPDLFAVAATLVEANGVYAHPCFTNGWQDGMYAFDAAYVREVQRLGRRWAASPFNPPRELKRLWRTLLNFGDQEIGSFDPKDTRWPKALLKMMAVADEASAGAGFGPEEGNMTPVAYISFEQMLKAEVEPEAPRVLKHLPFSLCHMVPPDVACVQPKTNTPEIGCTLRSLSHHLALLPPRGVVEADWLYSNLDQSIKPLNLLLVPFPYVVHGKDFSQVPQAEVHSEGSDRYFRVSPGWLPRKDGAIDTQRITNFIRLLVAAARTEVSEVHGIVFPESALSDADCETIAEAVARSHLPIELFVCGTVAATNLDADAKSTHRNAAFTARLDNGGMLRRWRQGKHHRWRLEKQQIRRYHLGHVLDPGNEHDSGIMWWEQTDLWPRRCTFSVIRRGASLAVLICEDLARFDPVLPVINAVGPNLVIALLMDGQQWERRWPGRYASVLADDPGSSVLTLTCLGMIRRSWMPGENQRQTVALWKEPGNVAKELDLPPDHHALLVSLTMSNEKQVSLDMRDDGRQTVRFRLSAARGVRLQQDAIDDWPDLP